MIRAEDAVSIALARSTKDEVVDITLDEEEEDCLDYLEASIESSIHNTFDGGILDLRVPAGFASDNVINALKQRAEAAGWLIGIYEHLSDSGKRREIQVVFAPPRRSTSAAQKISRPPPCKRPKVLLVSDVPGWAFDQNMKDLAEYLADDFEFEHFYTENWFKGERPDWSKYHVIYEAYHRNPSMGIPTDRLLGAMRSQFFKPEKPGPPDDEDIKSVNRCRAFQLSAKRNYDELIDRCPNIVYLTNPVNMRRFPPPPKHNKIVASWNGNAMHKAMDGRVIKGFYDFVIPSCIRANVPLVAAEYGTVEGPRRRRTSAEMTDFYRQSNVALCASAYESASNSIMEGMASGLALIATDVGNHRELRDKQLDDFGDSGILLVDRSVDMFAGALRELTPKRAAEMGNINRKSIIKDWSWDVWKERYRDFIRSGL